MEDMPPDPICPDCNNTEWFIDYTQDKANYFHFQCCKCNTEITCWKDIRLRELAAADDESLPA